MPQPTSNKQRNGHRKSASNPTSRPKGITMEVRKKIDDSRRSTDPMVELDVSCGDAKQGNSQDLVYTIYISVFVIPLFSG